MFNVDLVAEAEDELSEAYDWYEQQLPGLGNKFYKEVNHYLTLLEHDPFQFPVRYVEQLRAVPLNKFPFLIIYWIDQITNMIFVVSIFHTSRDPKYF